VSRRVRASALLRTALAALLLLFAFAPAALAQDRNETLRRAAVESAREDGVRFPALAGRRVVDEANILPAEVEARLTQKLAALEAQTTDQVVVATVPSLQDRTIEDYGYRLGRVWGIGQSEATQTADDRTGRDNGVILLVAPNERKVRIEVGYGLTPVLTDALSGLIVHNEILPRFRDGDLPGGVEAGVDAIVEQLSIDRGVAVQRAQQAAAQASDAGAEVPWWVVIAIILFFVFFGRGWLPWFILGNLAGGGWRGGGGGGWGGGGFSGGGGSFGGGGASGSW
jgi:uncharacterized protein